MSMSPVDPITERFEQALIQRELAEEKALPSPHIFEALRAEVNADLSSKPSKKVRTRAERCCLSVLAIAFGVLLTTITAFAQQAQLLLLSAAAYSMAVGVLLFAGAIPGKKSPWARGSRRILLAALALALFVLLALQANHVLPLSAFVSAESLAPTGKCFTHSLISGILCSGILMLLWKRSDPFSPGLTGAFLGFLGGLVGTISVEINCMSQEGLHLTLGHGLAAFLLIGIGFLSGRKWLTP